MAKAPPSELGQGQTNRFVKGFKRSKSQDQSEGPPGAIESDESAGKIPDVPVAFLTKDGASAIERVLNSAAEYEHEYLVAMNTEHPKLPGKCRFPLAVQLLRCLRGMTQYELAEACGIKNQSYISMIEKEQGKVPQAALLLVQHFLEIPDDLIEGNIATPATTQATQQPEKELVHSG